jgi:hypothetical protein
MAHKDSRLRRSKTKNRLIVQTIQTGCLSGLKINAGLATQRGIDDHPFQVVVRLKADAQCFARSAAAFSWRARSRRAYSSGRISLK